MGWLRQNAIQARILALLLGLVRAGIAAICSTKWAASDRAYSRLLERDVAAMESALLLRGDLASIGRFVNIMLLPNSPPEEVVAHAQTRQTLLRTAAASLDRIEELGMTGFAVVASEVKTLAAQTTKATEQIGSQLSQMQGETTAAV
jgi:hypothetical protein